MAPDIFSNFDVVKNHKIANNAVTDKAKKHISTDLESLEFYTFFDVCLAKFKSN
jgi:hypothetical protein